MQCFLKSKAAFICNYLVHIKKTFGIYKKILNLYVFGIVDLVSYMLGIDVYLQSHIE